MGWVLQHKPLDRSWRTSWSGHGIHKYGGCLEATPCYIGLVKAVKALQAYEHATGGASAGAGGTRAGQVRRAIDTGVEYILDHRLYLRASREEPITGHLLDVSFPESYHLNLLEVLAVIDAAGRLHDPRCRQALDHLASRRSETTGSWKVSFRYTGKGWVAFDPAGQPAEWVTYLAQRFLTRGQADQRGQAEQADHPPDA